MTVPSETPTFMDTRKLPPAYPQCLLSMTVHSETPIFCYYISHININVYKCIAMRVLQLSYKLSNLIIQRPFGSSWFLPMVQRHVVVVYHVIRLASGHGSRISFDL